MRKKKGGGWSMFIEKNRVEGVDKDSKDFIAYDQVIVR